MSEQQDDNPNMNFREFLIYQETDAISEELFEIKKPSISKTVRQFTGDDIDHLDEIMHFPLQEGGGVG